ncbi:prolipoprotein diacylglyceryl transferase [Chondrinema litorale]|uniref:prolipoprotein diacylglyceryl transferase n=1 Tax=Chondrinema litorale TaxID=2994555 RepID=UPI00254444B1|nr:prolipoprotein diacylglyceryl transferase [Chondrinema litorale]UZR94847.1 prolipoprotein diacylglyceryl transferase [Chondrinema litorale]
MPFTLSAIDFLNFINWGPDPEIFPLGPLSIRWYGLLFALGFLTGQYILIRIFRAEGKPEQDVETLTLYMVLATILGARLGHCLFYDPEYYLSNPLEILRIWKGGLASHGAAFGILFSLYLYVNYDIRSKTLLGLIPYSFSAKKVKRKGQSYLWIVDRIVIVVALAGCFIRLGNLMNSEIVGMPTDLPWGFVFTINPKYGDVPRHPAQLYESISCLIIFFILLALWSRKKAKTPEGLLLGLFLVLIFGLRFFYEFLKEVQEDFESDLPLKMGQILSIPLVIAGIYLLYRVYTGKAKIPSDE